MKVSKVEPGQAARSEMTRVQVLHLAATVGTEPLAPAQELAALASSRYVLVRWFASEARLALAYAGCAGTGFIKALLDFETAMADLSAKWQSRSPLKPDEGPEPNLTVVPERWFGLLAAGIICTGPELIAHLDKWLDESSQEQGVDAALTNAVRLILDGAARPAETLYAAIMDTTNPVSMRCGAAARLLLDKQTASKTLQLQGFLASAIVSDGSFTRQELFNRHIARRFSISWRAHARNRFQFQSPRVSVPMLLRALDDVEHGSGTLRSVLAAAASATGQPLGSFMDRVS